ncbi:MAG: hypothetical protein J0L78_12615 [Planctomycetes bacterium]|nr:hypothetical protein [Planctomycetota bacterium]
MTHAIETAPADDPVRFVRRYFGASFTVDDLPHVRNFVIDPSTGEIVASLPPSLNDAEPVVIHIPEESHSSLQIMAEMRALDPNRDASCDRLLIYHGRSEGAKIAALRPIDVKWPLGSVQIEDFFLTNPLAKDEPRICRMMNSDPGALGSLVLKLSGRSTIEPRVVGVDSMGLDVRTRTGVVRIEVPVGAAPDQAAATIETWMRKS